MAHFVKGKLLTAHFWKKLDSLLCQKKKTCWHTVEKKHPDGALSQGTLYKQKNCQRTFQKIKLLASAHFTKLKIPSQRIL